MNVEHLAEQLRRDLWRVGVRRPQLHESTKGHQRIRAHDLRATLVTISPATGKSETWISDRTGHRFHEMIETYRRRSRTRNLGDLGPLCELIRELQKASDWAANGQRHHRTGGEIGRRSGFRFREDEGKPSEDAANRPDPKTRSHEIERDDTGAAHSMPNPATVEDALALAVVRASAAGQWAVVAQLAHELEARRVAAERVADLRSRSGPST